MYAYLLYRESPRIAYKLLGRLQASLNGYTLVDTLSVGMKRGRGFPAPLRQLLCVNLRGLCFFARCFLIRCFV